MHFGNRNIRSAGRGSGSVEVTLPVELGVLEGIACRLDLRDGLAPEIVLQPDLQVIMPVFEKLWELLSMGLEEIDEIGDFAEADYGFGLFGTAKLGAMPSLAYADALVDSSQPRRHAAKRRRMRLRLSRASSKAWRRLPGADWACRTNLPPCSETRWPIS